MVRFGDRHFVGVTGVRAKCGILSDKCRAGHAKDCAGKARF
jgi:hypothetical protein